MAICELLGAPLEDRELPRGWSERISSAQGGDDARAAMGEFMAYTSASGRLGGTPKP
ncbi:hypothetical protein ACFS5L_38635 [Streptomyces phyllanthi]|uniref:hypothetical protein n=1 Tax=Streptomyces phyllanthi TaxID=1803180 RepID=UPI0018836BE5|nr:hypothetical protein [Streptomyces phyllanthi]